MFFEESRLFEQIIWTIVLESHQGNIFAMYNEIGPMVSDKKSFKVFYTDI